ncbi:MAG: hypothetical protein ACRC7H_10545, partial [Plesiomonas shigelloides]
GIFYSEYLADHQMFAVQVFPFRVGVRRTIHKDDISKYLHLCLSEQLMYTGLEQSEGEYTMTEFSFCEMIRKDC